MSTQSSPPTSRTGASLTAPYTLEQNRVAEHFNRTFIEKVRPMLFDAKLEDFDWVQAALTATYSKNRSPSSHHPTQTPWELFSDSKPDVSGMRVFGAKAYVRVPKQVRQKLNAVSQARVSLIPRLTPNEDACLADCIQLLSELLRHMHICLCSKHPHA